MEDSVEQDGPLTFEDLGLERSNQTVQTVFGKIRNPASLSKYEWGFLTICLLSLLASLGLTIERMVTLKTDSDDFTLAILLLVTTGFCFYYIGRGIIQESLYDILVFLIAVGILLVYCIINFGVSENRSYIKLGRLIAICVIAPIVISLGLYICKEYNKSGNLVYRTVGARLELQTICRRFQFALSLLAFDLQFQASILVLILKDGVNVEANEKIALGVGAIIAALYSLTTFLSMRQENKYGMIFSWILCPAEPTYVIYKLVTVYKIKDYSSSLRDTFYAGGVIAIVIRVCLVIITVIVYKSFGKGLKERMYGIEEEKSNTDDKSLPSSEENASRSVVKT